MCNQQYLKQNNMDTTIKEILKRKRIGIDCTEEESAEIKGWLKESKFVGEQKIVAEIQSLFPQEYGEYLDENESL